MLAEFAKARLGGLRMLPLSGGLFSGPFGAEMPRLTAAALRRAFDGLPDRTQHIVSVARLDMCIFVEGTSAAHAQSYGHCTFAPCAHTRICMWHTQMSTMRSRTRLARSSRRRSSLPKRLGWVSLPGPRTSSRRAPCDRTISRRGPCDRTISRRDPCDRTISRRAPVCEHPA